MTEVAKFEQGMAVVVTGEKAEEFVRLGKGHVVTVYSPSQSRKFNADYSVIFKTGEEFDFKESELEQA